jgi:hypothetical protein
LTKVSQLGLVVRDKTTTQELALMTIVREILERMGGITKWQQNFFAKLIVAILATHSRINFLNLARHSSLSEKTCRRQFRQAFDFARFNQQLSQRAGNAESQTAFSQDTTFSRKSGKQTFGLDQFWNGSAARAEKGLEVSLISLVDVNNHQALALSAEQTPAVGELSAQEKTATRIDFYLAHLQRTARYLPKEVKVGLFDGFYAKRKFVDGVVAMGLTMISKLRCDANLQYLYEGTQKRRGRRRKYDGKVQFTALSRFEKVESADEAVALYTLVVWSVSLQRQVQVVVMVKPKASQKGRSVVLFSSDTSLSAVQIVNYYKARFSIEFLFRDAKQFAGFSDCQARDKEALHYHFNASVTSVNVARWLAQERQKGNGKLVFSMSSIKQRCGNEQLLDLFIAKLGLEQTVIKQHPQFEKLRNYGAIAA